MLPVPAVMNRAISDRAPSENIEQATSRLRQLGFEISIKRKLAFQIDPETGQTLGWRNELDRLTFAAKDGADRQQAAKIVGALLAPARDEEIHLWLADLSAVTARRSEGTAEGVLTLAAYTDRLIQYPGDIVRHVLREWRGKWFPTWGEICSELDAMTKERLALRDRLQAMIDGLTTPQLEAKPKSQRLDDLRAELAKHNQMVLRYPELDGPEAQDKRNRLLSEIRETEG